MSQDVQGTGHGTQRLVFTRQVCKSPNAVQMLAGRMELGSGQCSEEVDNGLGWTSCSAGLWTLPVEETISDLMDSLS